MNIHIRKEEREEQAEGREKVMNKSFYYIKYDSFKDTFSCSKRILSKVRIPIQRSSEEDVTGSGSVLL
jgi:hypothetical protein